mgnify:CR=1 FL=1
MEDLIELYKKRDALAKENADASDITNIINKNWVVKEPKPIILTHSYYENPDFYEHYDNYDAIEVPRVELIPYDYEGVIGVPLTFLGARNRIYFCAKTQQNSNFLHLFSCTQFEIIGLMSGAKNSSLINGNDGRTKFYINGKGIYARILVKKVS